MLGEKPTPERFERFIDGAAGQGAAANREMLKRAYFSAAVLTGQTHESAVKLLSFLAQHLGMLSIQVFISPQVAEPSCINRARAYIHEHQSEKIHLAHVASVVNLNTFYFRKIFKRVTGLNFTDYVARVRIENSKVLLANAELSVAEIALASGFQTITHFNRVFKKHSGCSPTAFRHQTVCG
jgi:YesN/AraC family two-component response regulator